MLTIFIADCLDFYLCSTCFTNEPLHVPWVISLLGMRLQWGSIKTNQLGWEFSKSLPRSYREVRNIFGRLHLVCGLMLLTWLREISLVGRLTLCFRQLTLTHKTPKTVYCGCLTLNWINLYSSGMGTIWCSGQFGDLSVVRMLYG